MKKVTKFEKSVIVVGAGAAGITAASRLKSVGFDVLVLEASSRTGGRILTEKKFAPFPLEMGAEFVHGHRTDLYRGLKKGGFPFANRDGLDYYLYMNDLFPESEMPDDEEVRDFFFFCDELHTYKGEDVSVREFLDANNVPFEMRNLYESACAALGSSSDRIGMASIAKEERLWDAGEQNFRLCVSLWDYFARAESDLEGQILLNEEVKVVRTDDFGSEVITKSGKSFRADFVLITVPLTILQRNLIIFDPPLSEKKRDAIHAFGMDAGMKLTIKFSEQFFPEDIGYLLGADCANEYWFPAVGRHEENTYITCFATGKTAERYTNENIESTLNILDEIIEELQKIFRVKNLYASYQNHIFQDWTNEKHIFGAYSFARPGASGKRKFLAETHQERVFFAGEACATNGHAATVHGAVETAENAVAEIMAKVMQK